MSRNARNYRRHQTLSRSVLTRNMSFERYVSWFTETYPDKPLSLRYTRYNRFVL